MSEQKGRNYLVISALGEDEPGIVEAFTGAVKSAGCNVEDSRMTVLGGQFAIIVMVSGSWSAVAKLEGQLDALGQRLGLSIAGKRAAERKPRQDLVPYDIEVVAMDHPGIVYELAGFFTARRINIEELTTSTYPAPHTGTPMFSVRLVVGIPSHLHIASLRSDFLDFCDELNLDAVIEPAR